MSTIATLVVRMSASTQTFHQEMDRSVQKMNQVSQSFTKAGTMLTAGLSVPIAGVAVAFAKSAMDLEATEAKYNTVFGNMTDQADAFISEFQKLTPATKAEARSMASGIQDLLVPMGFMRDEATKMTGELMHVTGALANFNSGTHTAEQVSAAMQSAILGRYEALAGLGVQLDATTVKEKAVEMGLAATTGEVTKQHQVLVMLDQVYKQSGDALDAYTEANLDAKTQLALMKTEAIDVAAAFGTHLIPFINDTIGKIREAVEWFGNLSEEQQLTILKVMGLTFVIGPLLIVIGKLAAAITSITTLTNGAAVAFGLTKATGLAGAAGTAGVVMAAIPVGLIVAGLATVMGAVFALRREYDNMGAAAKRAADLSRASFSGAGGAGGASEIAAVYRANTTARPGATTSSYMDPRYQRGTTPTTSSYMDPKLTVGGMTTPSGFGSPTYNLERDMQSFYDDIANSIGGGSSGGGGGGSSLNQTMVDIMTKLSDTADDISRLLHVSLAPLAYHVIDSLKRGYTRDDAGGMPFGIRMPSMMNQYLPAMEGSGSRVMHEHTFPQPMRVEGVNDRGELVGVFDVMLDDLRREIRSR